MGGPEYIPIPRENSCAKVASIKEIAGMDRGSRDGQSHGDLLLVLVFEASANLQARERVKLAIRATLDRSGRSYTMWV
jgi:hypothetical protein